MDILFVKKSPLQDLLSSLNAVISTIRSTRIITDHVINNPAYTYKLQLKPTLKVGIFQRKILPTMKRQMS